LCENQGVGDTVQEMLRTLGFNFLLLTPYYAGFLENRVEFCPNVVEGLVYAGMAVRLAGALSRGS
jgi:hypothetical protein